MKTPPQALLLSLISSKSASGIHSRTRHRYAQDTVS